MDQVVRFFKDKKIFLTGHTGFKGSWLCEILKLAKARVLGYSLMPKTEPALFNLLSHQQNSQCTSSFGDVRDLAFLKKTLLDFQPEIVIHMAAQPLVRESYHNPVATYATNVMGTVNLLEAVRHCPSVKSFLNVTTDKVYENKEWFWGYRENEHLDGYDPYSNSKSCSELVTHSYERSFFKERQVALSTARAGNVIGGGDFSSDRILPDCIRAARQHIPIVIRNPQSIRPYQHVLEPLFAYLSILKKQWEKPDLAGHYNVGPKEEDCLTTKDLVRLFCDTWGEEMTWKLQEDATAFHEANFLKLDCSKIKAKISWQPHWTIETAVEKTVAWTKAYFSGEEMSKLMQEQIIEYMTRSH